MTRAPSSVLILLGLLLALLWLAPEVPLLGFAGMLVAVALRAAAVPLARHTGMGEAPAVLLVAVAVAALLGLGIAAAIGPLAEQATQLAEQAPRGLDALREWLRQLPGGERLLGRLQSASTMESATGIVASAATDTLGVLGNAVVVVLVGLYLALAPEVYLSGLTALVAPAQRGSTRAAMHEAERRLRGWLLGQGFAMLVTGVATWVGLALLGLPLAGVLAVIAALLGFIPVIGAVLSAVPAILLALAQDPWLALWVGLVFVVVQNIEGNILTPLVQDKAAHIPPALLLLAQLLMGALFGLLGVALAAPGLAVALVLVRHFYVRGWLEQRLEQR